MRKSTFALIAAVTILFAASALAADYKVVDTWKLGGDGGWDYLLADSAGHRLFIARATRVMVVDTNSGKQTGEIPDTPGVHGIALDPADHLGFTSNGRENTVTEFDLGSLKVVKKIKVGNGPDAILYDPFSKRVFTFNGKGGHDATAIDAAKGEVVGTLDLGGKPEFAATEPVHPQPESLRRHHEEHRHPSPCALQTAECGCAHCRPRDVVRQT